MHDLKLLVAAQFNKMSRDRSLKTARDIRNTGEVEEKANAIIILDRPLDLVTGVRSSRAHCRVDKNTLGSVGPFELAFSGMRYLFADVDLEAA